ncbi:MAG: ECF transporter S component [Bacteroidaceae bacterium]|jgi:glucose-6-phosphate-specific signal transduction histidine kinase
METQTAKLYTLSYSETKTYLIAALFVAGNIVLPQLCHLMPQGGVTWLPIYFFTLVGAYKYGWKAGLLTAIASPLLNSMLFGMPAPAVLPAILLKSTLLAMAAGVAASRFRRVSLLLLAAVVASYQIAGSLGEWILTGSLYTALQDVRIGLPGMLLQIFGGYAFIKYLLRR